MQYGKQFFAFEDRDKFLPSCPSSISHQDHRDFDSANRGIVLGQQLDVWMAGWLGRRDGWIDKGPIVRPSGRMQ